MEFVQPIRDKRQLTDMQEYLKENFDYKYYIMFMLGIYSALRVTDILELRVRDVKKKGKIVDAVKVTANKTGKEHVFPLNQKLKSLLKQYCEGKSEYEFLVPNERTHKSISRVQAWRVLSSAAQQVGIDNIGTHSMRKTFGYHFYMQTKDIVLLQTILGHSDPSITKRYIGLTQDTIIDSMKRFSY